MELVRRPDRRVSANDSNRYLHDLDPDTRGFVYWGMSRPMVLSGAWLVCHDAARYDLVVIRSFKDRNAEAVWKGQRSRQLPYDVQRIARRKLRMLNNAADLNDLRVPPGNRLEPLRGNRRGQYSIRINDQWRICFVWEAGEAQDVEIVDYH